MPIKHKKLIFAIITILLCAAFGGASAVVFIYGKRFYDSDWFFLLYVVAAFLFICGWFMVIFPKLMFKMIYNKHTVKSMENSYYEYVAPEYMAKHFFMKFRWGLMGVGVAVVWLIALLCLVL